MAIEWDASELSSGVLCREPGGLSPAQLLTALLAPGGIPEAEGLSRRLLDRFGGLSRLGSADPAELLACDELGPGSALRLIACFELGRQAAREKLSRRPAITCPADAAQLLAPGMRGLRQEQFRALLLDSKHRVIRDVLIAQGGLNSAVVHPRDVLRPAILASAAALLLVHNHPSGDPEPSEEDFRLTARFLEASRLVGIELLDHLVMGGGETISLKERGALA